jgi:hypothetical protein
MYFIACFSEFHNKKNLTYMNIELRIAIDQMRMMPDNKVWFIPVLLSPCEIPEFNIGAGQTLHDIQWISLFEDWDGGLKKIINVIKSEP